MLPMLLTAAGFIIWDAIFTEQGVWWFSHDYTLPYRLLGLPLEEWLFFIVVPYACAFVAACLDAYFPVRAKPDWKPVLILAAALLIIAALNYYRAYTFWACGLCALGLIVAWLLRERARAFHPQRFLLAYGVCIVPFLVVNGLLTSLPVVLYNDAENVGIRIYTIPAEDIFYGMLLILGSVWGMRAQSTSIAQDQPDR
jgi:lycopene cyclase domain-containing protein